MVQFKDMFMGRSTVYPTRVVSVQKCVRAGGKHNDLSNVGFTNRHLTFFEMLGNFSFGDYGAREAIRFAWMFLTSELGLPSDRLAVSVLRDDHDTAELWRAHGLASDRIFRCDPQDNFWSMGDGPGPCGPCTEIFWDQGELVDGDRWLEIWNIVLMNLNRGNDGSLAPLARPCIDTGMGLERIASILQGRRSNFDIDTLAPLVQDAGRLIDLKAEHGRGREWVGGRTAGLRVVADHLRSAAFLIADGVTPSNVGRGYVLRRIIRRAVLFSTLSEPFLGELYGTLEHTMGTDYPELAARRDHVVQVLGSEEEAFNRTLDKGLHELRNFFQRNEVSSGQHRNLQQRSPPPPTQSSPQPLPSQSPSPDTGQPLRTAPKTLPSAFVHRLYDTFGFPVDLTLLLCSNRGWTVDHQEVDRLMEEQRTRARASWIASGHSREFLSTISSWEAAGFRTEYCGDATTSVSQCTVRALARSRRDDATLVVAIDPCPLYPEGGGQVGDLGTLCIGQHTFPVVDTQRPFEGGIAVQLRVPESLDLEHAAQLLQPGTECSVHVDVSRRRRTSAHHSATHLLQHALREVLGPHVCQAGSSVAPSGLRFDFSHSPLSTAQVKQVEDRVNELCLSDFPVVCSVLPLSEALGTGALSFFAEKYADVVRVVQMGPSRELCGGTHAVSTRDVWPFRIVAEGSVAAGTRRIDAVAGTAAVDSLTHAYKVSSAVVSSLGLHGIDELPRSIQAMVIQRQALHKEISNLKKRLARAALPEPELTCQMGDVAWHLYDVSTLHTDVDSVRASAEELTKRCETTPCVHVVVYGDVVVLAAKSVPESAASPSSAPPSVSPPPPPPPPLGLHAGRLLNVAAMRRLPRDGFPSLRPRLEVLGTWCASGSSALSRSESL